MAENTKNYSTKNIGTFEKLSEKGRIELGNELGLTGCEISLNSLPAGRSSPFWHTHTLNEETYIVISGNGTFKVDDDVFPIEEGSVVRVAPAGVRGINSGSAGLVYICIQAQENSLTQKTQNDGNMVPVK
ncbi:cupin domain-containing protein [Breznakiella homolactica]|uniref:Cupin domain-containing protein n=1 Tax=Breznakiella homolactica TaxID=2798577 RepID=A0A7T7XJT6_9SPIR|nr:cupin domain-containing protein [Breznakiella homolactica]QQO07681.1 cupin domain-containing protein [Breznakiella homolactica]